MAAYGIADATVDWYTTIVRKLDQVGVKECSITHCLFYAIDHQGNKIGQLALHVDDMMFAGTKDFHANLKRVLQGSSTGPVKKANFEFLGMKTNTETDQEGRHYCGITPTPTEGKSGETIKTQGISGND